MKPEDIFFKKNVTYNFWKQSLVFRTSQELFSSHDVDLGTQFLLRSIVEADYPAPKSILDMGCGYGPLGLTLKKIYPGCSLHLVDRDALAVEYSSQNAGLNGLDDVEVYGSLGYDDLKRPLFDMIVSNIPGKAGERVIASWLNEAGLHLAPGGVMAVVVVSALEEMAGGVLEKNPGITVLLKRSRSGHSVFHFRFSSTTINAPAPAPQAAAFERGIYLRNSQKFRFENLEYAMQTAFGLPEFDSLDFRSEMLMKALMERPGEARERAAVINPGQGHTAVALWAHMHPLNLTLIDRDLLALRYARHNLTLNHCPEQNIVLRHQAGLSGLSAEKYDLITWLPREEEGAKALDLALIQAAEMLSDKGLILVSAGSTAITRLVALLHQQPLLLRHPLLRQPLRILSREKRRGNSLLVLARP